MTDISIHALLAESDRSKIIAQAIANYISIHALLAESDAIGRWGTGARDMSIHALLAESDAIGRWGTGARDISIHALLAESDQLAARDDSIMFVFLSTLSLRRATCAAPCARLRLHISIHALLAESDRARAPE